MRCKFTNQRLINHVGASTVFARRSLSFPKSEDSDWARVELATHCFVVVVWNADCWTTNPAFLFVLCSDLWKKRNSSETVFPCIFIARLRCRIAKGAISYCILLHPLFSAARHETFFFFFFLHFLHFFFFSSYFDFDLHSFQLFTYVGNSLGVHGDFLPRCRVTVG